MLNMRCKICCFDLESCSTTFFFHIYTHIPVVSLSFPEKQRPEKGYKMRPLKTILVFFSSHFRTDMKDVIKGLISQV